MSEQAWRLRDPVHGLVVFRESDPVDRLAWSLIQTPEFQRLRRIRQLGVSEFVFPGATHTRFAHSVGVFNNARRLMQVIEKEEGRSFDPDRAKVALIAALLHDLGHGPFSHAFEGARETIARSRGRDAIEKHEKFTAKMILAEDGDILPILGARLADNVAALIQADNPVDIYHAVVSSSFDADRLDYLMRDRYMTGTQAGSIDLEWLLDNLATDEISIPQDDDPPFPVRTFVFKLKGRQAAEDFLLARYRLYTQVYLHKTTRGFECLLKALFQMAGEAFASGDALGLGEQHPLVRFFTPGGETLANYRDLDDTVAGSAVERLRGCARPDIQTLATRLWHRQPLRVLDIAAEMGHDSAAIRNAVRRLSDYALDKVGQTIFWDQTSYNLYSDGGGEIAKAHKLVRIRNGDGATREIHEFPDSVIADKLMDKTSVTRLYFLTDEERARAEKVMKGR